MRRPKLADDATAPATPPRAPKRQREERQPYASEVEDYAGEKARAPGAEARSAQSPSPTRRR